MDDVLDWIGEQLLAAERAPLGRTTRVRRHSRVGVAVALVSSMVACASIAEAAGVINLPAIWQQQPNVASPEGIARSVPVDLTQAFAILRRPAQPPDALPPAGVAAMTVPGGLGGHYGVNAALARLAGSVDGILLWLVPGSLGSCVYAGDKGSFCVSNAIIATSGVQGVLVPDAGGAVTFLGVVPDGATVTAANADGSPATVTRDGDAYIVSGDASLRSVTVHQTDGGESTSAAPAAARSVSSTARLTSSRRSHRRGQFSTGTTGSISTGLDTLGWFRR